MIVIKQRNGESIILGTNGEKAIEAGLGLLSTNRLSPEWIKAEAKRLLEEMRK